MVELLDGSGPPPKTNFGKEQRRLAALSDRIAAMNTTETTTPISLGEALPLEMARVRDEVIPIYQTVGPAANLAIAMMRHDLDRAAKAMAEGDVVEMLRVYQSLKECEV